MSQRTKDLLAAAAGPTGTADQSWHADRVDRLYFSDPKDLDAAGQVDVIDSASYVRIELWIRPELAAQIIGLVTGEVQAVDARLRHEIRAELLPTLRADIEREHAAAQAAEKAAKEAAEPKPPAAPTPDDPRSFAARDTAAKADLARRDTDRMEELTILVRQQAAEESADTAAECESDSDDEEQEEQDPDDPREVMADDEENDDDEDEDAA